MIKRSLLSVPIVGSTSSATIDPAAISMVTETGPDTCEIRLMGDPTPIAAQAKAADVRQHWATQNRRVFIQQK